MSNSKELFDYKNRLMEDILSNDNIIEMITDNMPSTNTGTLAYKQIFPFEFLPETIEEGHTFICFDSDIYKVDNSLIYEPYLYIWIFTHKSKLRYEGGGVRSDLISEELSEMLNGSRYYGLGELELHSNKRFSPLSDYKGRVLTFSAKDWNRFNDRTKSVPSNRKAGV